MSTEYTPSGDPVGHAVGVTGCAIGTAICAVHGTDPTYRITALLCTAHLVVMALTYAFPCEE